MKKILVTGAAGFIGGALFQQWTHPKIGIDNFSRSTSARPLIRARDEFYRGDIADIEYMALPDVDTVIHLAAQTSVMRSYTSPWADFRDNAAGTLRMLLWARYRGAKTFIYASTNKVFGEMAGNQTPTEDDAPMNPVTPYGVSKAMGAHYVREIFPEGGYVFHQSCIYGEGQTGTEDQGWVGHLLEMQKQKRKVICYGDGSQTRDLLHVKDLLDAYAMAIARQIRPGSYVIGGGIENAHSFQGVARLIGNVIESYRDWRPHDQKFFVSANRGLLAHGWRPKIRAGVWIPKAAAKAIEKPFFVSGQEMDFQPV